MDFDFSQIAVPFRMQPGLRRLALGTHSLSALQPESTMHAEKLAVLQAGQSRLQIPGFDAQPALCAIARYSGLDVLAAQALPLELIFEEDFAVLDGANGTLPWLCVCLPSHWAPEGKLGLDFASVHAPVADNQALLAAADRLLALVTAGECWERWVWTITPSGRYDQHPLRHPRTPWPLDLDPQALAAQCWLRAERQVFFPVGQGTRQAVFAIRVMLQPLVDAVRAPGAARRLHDSLASMSQAVLDYKNLSAAQAPLLRWLRAVA